MVPPPLLVAQGLRKSYRKHKHEIPVIRELDLAVPKGIFLSIIGASGSGKSTLLHLLGTLDRPDEGQIHLDGRRIDHLPNCDRDHLRNHVFGFIFQFYHLLPELTVLENLMTPNLIRHSVLGWLRHRRAVRRRADELLERVGLGDRRKHRPCELSGGEMQRAAIARALMGAPQILLADEPTGNLDVATGAETLRLLRDLNRQEGLTIIMVTHNMEVAATCDQTVRMAAGRLDTCARAA